MEVKAGYKQTEVGVIPEGWEVKPLQALGKFAKGKGLLKEDIKDSGRIPAIPYTALYTDFSELLNYNHIKWFIDDDTRTYIASEPCVLIASSSNMEANTGKASALTGTTPVAIGREVIIFKTTSDSSYISYLLSTQKYRRKTLSLARGTTIKHLYPTTFLSYKIALPPAPEQRAIATALSDVDALLGALERLITKKRDLKQAAMQQLLTGQTRIPGFHGEWEVKRLGDVGEISSAGVDKKIRPDEVPVRLVNYLDVYQKDFIYSEDLNHWVTAPPHQAKRCAVQKGDVFFTPTSETRDDIGISAVAMEDIPDAAYSYHVARLRLREPWDLCFRTYAFKTRAFLDQAETLCDGNGTRYVISQGKFRSMTVQVPPIPEQTAIAAVLTEMDAELAVLEQRQAKTRALKQGMMQELLTGRTRLVGLQGAAV